MAAAGKMIGNAVGVVLENQGAIKDMGAPVANHAQSVLQVAVGTLWKSIVAGAAMLALWFGIFVVSYLSTNSTMFIKPIFMGLFGIFLFVFLPLLVGLREIALVRKKHEQRAVVIRANKAVRDKQREAAQAELMAQLEAQQYMQQQQYMPQQGNYQK